MSGTGADGEVVWSWRAHAGAKLSRSSKGFVPMTVANAGSPRRAPISRNPPRREGRLSPPVPVVHALAQISFAREPRVHAATRPSLRPPFSRGTRTMQNSGKTSRENKKPRRQSFRGPSFETSLRPLLRMRSSGVAQSLTPHGEERGKAARLEPSGPCRRIYASMLRLLDPQMTAVSKAIWKTTDS